MLQPLEGPLRGALSQLGDLLSRQSDLQFPIRSPQASTWLLNTYLDEVSALRPTILGPALPCPALPAPALTSLAVQPAPLPGLASLCLSLAAASRLARPLLLARIKPWWVWFGGSGPVTQQPWAGRLCLYAGSAHHAR